MSVNISITFPTLEDAIAFLVGRTQSPAATITVTPSSPAPAPVIEAPKAAPVPAAPAPAPAPAAQADAPLDFKRDVVEALRGYSKRVPEADFRAYMTSLGVAKVTALEAMPERWAEIVAHCNG